MGTMIGISGALTAVSADRRERRPVRLILDTDFCGDCDDVLALGLIHALEARGDCRLLAVTVSADDDRAAPLVDAVNRFYGRTDVPIGVVGAGGVKGSSAFLAMVDEREGDDWRYPHVLKSGREAPPAIDVLRKALAAEEDGSVVVLQIGFATNLARLIASKPDQHSILSGSELVAKKVRLLSLMAGAFEPIDGVERYREFNVAEDVESMRTLARRWPSPLVWSGFEVGRALRYPSESIDRDFGFVAHHPLAEAYRRRNPPPHDRPTWDLTSALFAIRPDRGYFDLSCPGTVAVEDDGSTRFLPNPDGRHRYLIVPPEKRPRVIEAMVQLASQPPSRRRSGD